MKKLDLSRLTNQELLQLTTDARAELEKLKRKTAFLMFKPRDEKQRAFLESEAKFRIAVTGNRWGKTLCGGVDLISAATGVPPRSLGGKMPPDGWPRGILPGKRFLACGETFETVFSKTIGPKLEALIDPEMLERAPRKNQQGFPCEYTFVSGARLSIMSYQQPVKFFEGSAWDKVWFDEPPDSQRFKATLRGMMETQGTMTITATLLDQGAWILDELVAPSEDETHPLFGRVEYFRGETHDNCLLEGSRVSGRFTGGLKARYAGPAVEVVTVGGERLRVTANHPVLTARGIVPARELHEGDALLRQHRQVVGEASRRNEENQDRGDPTVEEVFEALAAQGRGGRERASLDLDGDERLFLGEEVDAVGLLSLPPERRLPSQAQGNQRAELALELSDSSAVLDCWRGRTSAPPGGPSSSQPPGHFVSSAEPLPLQPHRVGAIAELDSVLPKAALQSVLVATRFFGQLLDRHTGHVLRDEVRDVRHFDYLGHVYDFSTEVGYFASDNLIVRNCLECNGGYIPHEEILLFESQLNPLEKKARLQGVPMEHQSMAFGYVTRDSHVVPDLDLDSSMPLIEVMDPSLTRGLFVGWFTCDADDYWYWVQATNIPDNSFKIMCDEIKRFRQLLPRQPQLAVIDARGGGSIVNKDQQETWIQALRRNGLFYTPSVQTEMQTLHDWMRPQWDPRKEAQIPKLRLTRTVAALERGPLWAFQRFIWDQTDPKRFRRPEKDWIDLARYLAGFPGMAWEKLAQSKELRAAGRQSLAAAFAPKRRKAFMQRGSPLRDLQQRKVKGWLDRIQHGYD